MSRMESFEADIQKNAARKKAIIDAEGGMTEDDLYMRGGQIAAMFCIGFAFLVPNLLLIRVVF